MRYLKHKLSNRAIIAIFAVLAVTVFLAVRPVWALDALDVLSPVAAGIAAGAGTTPNSIAGAGAAGITGIGDIIRILVGSIIYLYIYFIGNLLLVIIKILVEVASYNDFVNSAVVLQGWSIVRDISNMFFIIILLAIAFGTILGYEQLNWKQRLPKLLIFAVLINFTRVISGLIIDFGQVIMITFVNGFKDAAGGNFAELLGIKQLLEVSVPGQLPQQIQVAQGDVGGAAIDFIQVISAMIGGAIFATVALIMVLLITLVLVYRMVMLWIYVTLSPIAFILGAFPQGESYYADWWKKMVSTVALGPVLAFFLWLTLLTVGQISVATGSTLAKDINLGSPTTPISCGASEACQPDSILKFIVGIGMLMGGLTVAQGLASSAGEGMGGLVGFAKRAGTGAIKKMTGVAAAQRGIKAYQDERAKAKGLGMAGGLGQKFGLGVNMARARVPIGGAKARKAVVGYYKERLGNRSTADLNDMLPKAGREERAAILSTLARRPGGITTGNTTRADIEGLRGVLDEKEYAEVFKSVQRSAPTLVTDFANPREAGQYAAAVRNKETDLENVPLSAVQAGGTALTEQTFATMSPERIASELKKADEAVQDEILQHFEALIASGADVPNIRQAFADITHDIPAAFPAALATGDVEAQRWVRRTETSMIANKQAAIDQARARGGMPPRQGGGGGGTGATGAGGGPAGGGGTQPPPVTPGPVVPPTIPLPTPPQPTPVPPPATPPPTTTPPSGGTPSPITPVGPAPTRPKPMTPEEIEEETKGWTGGGGTPPSSGPTGGERKPGTPPKPSRPAPQLRSYKSTGGAPLPIPKRDRTTFSRDLKTKKQELLEAFGAAASAKSRGFETPEYEQSSKAYEDIQMAVKNYKEAVAKKQEIMEALAAASGKPEEEQAGKAYRDIQMEVLRLEEEYVQKFDLK